MGNRFRRCKSFVLILSSTGVLLGAACSPPAPVSTTPGRPSAGTLFLSRERIPLQDRTMVSADRGWLIVPANRKAPQGGTLALEIYRFRAASDAPGGVPPVFRLFGGPGFQGLETRLAESGYYERSIAPWLKIADLVVVGQRGIGSTKPNTACEEPRQFEPDAEVTDDQVAEALREASARCKDFWEKESLDLKGLNVIEAAADVDDVRRALGYQKIILHGVSFGSHWGMAVMRFHPEIVERAILGGMEGPDHTYDMPSEVLHSFQEIAAAAERSDQLKGVIPQGGLIEAFKTVIARAGESPVNISVPDPRTQAPQAVRFDARKVRALAYGYTGSAASRSGLRTWPSDILALYRGDFRKAAEASLRNRSRRTMPTASFFMLDCGSGISAERREKLRTDPARAILGPLGADYEAACPVWQSDLGDGFRKNFETMIPTAIVHGNWDTSTPLENARELAPFFKRSRFVLVEGGTHGALAEAMELSEAFREGVLRFIRNGDMVGLPGKLVLPPMDWVRPGQ